MLEVDKDSGWENDELRIRDPLQRKRHQHESCNAADEDKEVGKEFTQQV
jgi:hypothetical protein